MRPEADIGCAYALKFCPEVRSAAGLQSRTAGSFDRIGVTRLCRGRRRVVQNAYPLGALVLLPAIPIEYAVRGFASTSVYGWLGVLYLGVLASAACYWLYNFALRSLDASTVGIYTNIDPVVGVACAFVFLEETLSPAQIVGALVVFAGIWLASSDSSTS